ncbi:MULTISPECIES: cysteine-rich CWC family protein [unclassified Lentimonas]
MATDDASTKCPKCGQSFACCVEQGGKCWCARVALSPDARSYLASQYDGCLCPDCLKAINPSDSICINSIG